MMKRNIPQLIQEYRDRFSGSRKHRYAFRRSDVRQVYDYTYNGKMSDANYFELICNSLEAGFVIGYKAAQMDALDELQDGLKMFENVK